jgi:hypothetical protein
MNWKFWEKESIKSGEVKLPGPKSIPEVVGRYLVVRLGKDPDWVWNLKSVSRPRPEGKTVFDVRVFNEAETAAKGIAVKNYASLDEHPEFIRFEGWYDHKTMKAEIQTKEKPLTRAA